MSDTPPNPDQPEPDQPNLDQRVFDEYCMRLALQLAQQGQGHVEPNPMVGCVLARDGQIIGQGYHESFGGPHAEVQALRSLTDSATANSCTAYVTLEPCCHHGKTPPCVDALINAGVRRVVVAMDDPFPKVSGGGLERLRQAGVEVHLGLLRADAAELNAPYLKRIRSGIPWVIAKWAMTMDGRIATVSGQSQWITGETARRSVHQLRARVDAILTGMGTVESDDPTLTARLSNTDNDGTSIEPSRVATRVVFCRHRLPDLKSKLMSTIDQAPVLLIVSDTIDESHLASLTHAGAAVFRCQNSDPSQMIHAGLTHLGKQSMTNVMLECGSTMMGSFLCPENLVDECHIYLGNTLFGGATALGPIGGNGFKMLAQAPRFRLVETTQMDNDLRIIYRSSTPPTG
ncbi:bifunctional diaminohydroxyphosphoribosylaminopyrimidine deaminase/5-amino-6-(5-phosphoribosylamino)uracil reductase RibD [Stieleria varia]|uniref:Riboflavin biosynthesis protein RibD n=1 Tax=Stieleria varia TaxID=2528005 RepID=A0A5C6B965_9BACT|nr:bifunctional diaminohydroxyphosphoribosylaminopyrimidine deaminase/5-amino-6-(5-phosphoribosylamino)uracil reductase RibD [Stieleria varia]TWU08182.1 Riboflavin biosynthesis protein RibD [Stieleria varia]